MKHVTVVGSCSVDYVVNTDVVPREGETVFGRTFETFFGGKGANQAVAASRLGAKVSMIGAVGDDQIGQDVLHNLEENGIDTQGMATIANQSTGVAHIIVKDGDNRIIIVPGSNGDLSVAHLEAQTERLLASDVVVLQHEIAADVVEWVVDFCDRHDIPTILNPAPARALSEKTLNQATYLTPNETEFEVLFPGQDYETVLKMYPNKLIITLGSEGAVFYDGKTMVKVPPFLVRPVDTTGAGDTFNGALAVGIVNGWGLKDSVTFGNLASSVAIQKAGAQAGIPTISVLKEHEAYEKTWHIE